MTLYNLDQTRCFQGTEYIEQRTAGLANKNIEKTFVRLEKESVKIGMLKKIDILGKWYSPETDLEKDLYKLGNS